MISESHAMSIVLDVVHRICLAHDVDPSVAQAIAGNAAQVIPHELTRANCETAVGRISVPVLDVHALEPEPALSPEPSVEIEVDTIVGRR